MIKIIQATKNFFCKYLRKILLLILANLFLLCGLRVINLYNNYMFLGYYFIAISMMLVVIVTISKVKKETKITKHELLFLFIEILAIIATGTFLTLTR